MTQERFAEVLDLSVDFLSLIERGKNAPSFETLGQNSEALANLSCRTLYLQQQHARMSESCQREGIPEVAYNSTTYDAYRLAQASAKIRRFRAVSNPPERPTPELLALL